MIPNRMNLIWASNKFGGSPEHNLFLIHKTYFSLGIEYQKLTKWQNLYYKKRFKLSLFFIQFELFLL